MESAFELHAKAELIQNCAFQIYPGEFRDERDGKTTLEDKREIGTAIIPLPLVAGVHIQM